jgi:hypothetical protein
MELVKPENKNQEKVLEVCNKIRKLYGCKPIDGLPKGVPGDPVRCPICKSLPTREEILGDGEFLYVHAKKDAEKIAMIFKSKVPQQQEEEYYLIKVPKYIKDFWEKFSTQSPHYKQLISDEPVINYDEPGKDWIMLISNVEKA